MVHKEDLTTCISYPIFYKTEDYKVEVDRQDIDEFDNYGAMAVQDTS